MRRLSFDGILILPRVTAGRLGAVPSCHAAPPRAIKERRGGGARAWKRRALDRLLRVIMSGDGEASSQKGAAAAACRSRRLWAKIIN
jgi:hypothetical protein